MISERLLLVLTACIAPPPERSSLGLRMMDPRIRLDHYVRALEGWLALADPRIGDIVFLESSGAPIDALRAASLRSPRGRRVEFVHSPEAPIPPGLHYGWADFRLLDEGLRDSRLWREGERAFLKATGRYAYPAISALLDRLPAGIEFGIDARRNSRFVPVPMTTVHTDLFIASKAFYDRRVRGLYRAMSATPRGFCVESVIFDAFHGQPDPGVRLRWPVNCDASGIGGNGDDLTAPRRRAKRWVRGMARRWTPSWWV